MKTGFCVLILAPVLAAAAVAPAARPNVLFIAADDLRNDLGFYGDRQVRSPHLDHLAARGVVFEHAYCAQALCNPSRASIMTGLRPDRLRVWDLQTHFRDTFPDIVTLPQHFMRNGYFAQNVGKIFHNWRTEIPGDPDSWSVPAELHFASHWHDHAEVEGDLPPNEATDPTCECRDVPDEAYYDGRVARLAVEALRERAARPDEPFFLAVGFWKPHAPFNAPKRYWDLYRREDVALAPNPEWPVGAPDIARHDGRELLRSRGGAKKNALREVTPDEAREMRHGYLAAISYLDAQIGRVLDELERLGLAKSTIVVFWSDHGFHLGEHDLWAKTSNFELDARVPLLLAAPGIPGGGRPRAPVELLDLFPTLAELAGLPPPVGVDGVSLVPAMRDPSVAVKPAALTQHPRPAYYTGAPEVMGYSLRTARHRYTEWRDWTTGVPVARELYDHEADPLETRNLAADPAQAQAVAAAAALMETFNPMAGRLSPAQAPAGKPAPSPRTKPVTK